MVIGIANEKNLIPLNRRTQRERIEIAKMGAVASNTEQKRRKSLRESMNMLLSLPINSVREYNEISKMGIDPSDIDNSQLIIRALFERAKGGDVAAFKEIRDLIGDKDSAGGEVKIIDNY